MLILELLAIFLKIAFTIYLSYLTVSYIIKPSTYKLFKLNENEVLENTNSGDIQLDVAPTPSPTPVLKFVDTILLVCIDFFILSYLWTF